MKEIQLTKDYRTTVDDSDYEHLSAFEWYAVVRKRKDSVVTCVYACRHGSTRNGQKRRSIYMHREILGIGSGRKPEVDHRDTNGLNNQRDNLRASTRSQQLSNTRLRIDNSSTRKGVHWDRKNGKWRAEITINGRWKFLGRFDSIEAASIAHDRAAVRLFGEFHRESVKVATMSVGD